MTAALLTDKYELTMLAAALRDGTAHRRTTFEVFARRLPEGRRYGVVAGTARFVEALAQFRFDRAELDWWQIELDRELPDGFFGENLRVEGLDVNAARVGEVWRIGATLEVQVTSPRKPCQTFARWVGGDDERAGRNARRLRLLS